MGLREVIRAGEVGLGVREFVTRHQALANQVTTDGALLPTFVARWKLSGGAAPDTVENQAAVDAVISSVPVPTDAELEAAAGLRLPEAARASIRAAIRREAALRYFLARCAAGLPSNDV